MFDQLPLLIGAMISLLLFCEVCYIVSLLLKFCSVFECFLNLNFFEYFQVDLNLLPPKPDRQVKTDFQKMFFSGTKFIADVIPNVPKELFTYFPDPGGFTSQQTN